MRDAPWWTGFYGLGCLLAGVFIGWVMWHG
jgi:hypothetical protein